MVASFDIFRVDTHGDMLWVEAVAEFEGAKQRVAELMLAAPCEYLIFCQKTGHKTSIKPSDGNGISA
jgi:hypothetical protein